MFREIRHVTRLGIFTSSVNMKFAKLQSGFVAGLVRSVKMILISRWGLIKRHRCGKTRFRLGLTTCFSPFAWCLTCPFQPISFGHPRSF